MRFLEFIHKVDEDVLLEAARDRYWQMFEVIPPEVLDAANTGDMATGAVALKAKIQSAMQIFQRSDRITWALRLHKHAILVRAREQSVNRLMGNTQISDEYKLQAEQVVAYVNQQEARLIKKSGMPDHELQHAASTYPRSIPQFEHFLSLPINGIQTYEFGWQQPSTIISEFRKLEQVWQEARKREVSHTEDYEDIEPIIQFPDGSAWFDLKRSSCGTEGDAMGHCGNTADTKDSHTVLSYRTPVEGQEGTWVPRMTFILDKEHGTLGEMKGYANEKPAEKYHPYIIELLKKDYVKGFGSGGYQPENNFSLNDLPEEQAEALKELKPGFRSPIEHYKIEGMTGDLVERISGMIQDVTGEKVTYVPEENEFIVDSYKNLDQAVEYLGGDTAEWISGVLEGTTSIDTDHWGSIDKYQMSELLDTMPTEILQKISLHIENKYGDEYEDDHDYNDTNDMVLMLDEQDDPIIDEIRRAISDGFDRGAENEMSETFYKWIDDLSNDYTARIKHEWNEGGATLRIGEESLAEMVSDESDKLYDIEHEGWKYALGIDDIEQPQYGFQGYDEETAKERFLDEFDEKQMDLTPSGEEA
jgi:hypothetical protein